MVLGWSVIFLILVRRYRQIRHEEPLFLALIVVLLMDALRTLMESIYQGVIQAAQIQLLPENIAATVTTPEMAVFPRAFSILVTFIILAIIFRQDVAQRQLERRRAQEVERLNESLRQIAATDELTGLFNYRRFQEALLKEVERARRFGRPLSLLFIDIDEFKAVNDRFGHQVGDVVLAQLAALLSQNLRIVDTVCRYGGEEFSILLPETTSDGATVAAERIRSLIANHDFGLDEPNYRITVSIGVASFNPATDDPASLVRRADQAMYAAKQAGRNCVRLAGQT